MPLTKLQFKPGINREQTSYTNEGGWFDGDKIRFRAGFPEKIGGWEKKTNDQFLGTCRALHPWVALDQSKYMAVGTNIKYYIEEGGRYFDITPIRASFITIAVSSSVPEATGAVGQVRVEFESATVDIATVSAVGAVGVPEIVTDSLIVESLAATGVVGSVDIRFDQTDIVGKVGEVTVETVNGGNASVPV